MYRRKFFDFDYACRSNGNQPAKRFYDSLPDETKANIKALLEKLGKERTLAKNRFKKLQGYDIWQLTEYDYRMLCFKLGRCFLFTNGFLKQSQRTPQRHVDLAVRIMREHLSMSDS